VALGKSRGFRPLRRATADRGGSDKPFEKGLSQNFKQINIPTNQNLKSTYGMQARHVLLLLFYARRSK